MTQAFRDRIAAMNAMYKLPANDKPTLPADTADRLKKFKATLMDEVHEKPFEFRILRACSRGIPFWKMSPIRPGSCAIFLTSVVSYQGLLKWSQPYPTMPPMIAKNVPIMRTAQRRGVSLFVL